MLIWKIGKYPVTESRAAPPIVLDTTEPRDHDQIADASWMVRDVAITTGSFEPVFDRGALRQKRRPA